MKSIPHAINGIVLFLLARNKPVNGEQLQSQFSFSSVIFGRQILYYIHYVDLEFKVLVLWIWQEFISFNLQTSKDYT